MTIRDPELRNVEPLTSDTTAVDEADSMDSEGYRFNT